MVRRENKAGTDYSKHMQFCNQSTNKNKNKSSKKKKQENKNPSTINSVLTLAPQFRNMQRQNRLTVAPCGILQLLPQSSQEHPPWSARRILFSPFHPQVNKGTET